MASEVRQLPSEVKGLQKATSGATGDDVVGTSRTAVKSEIGETAMETKSEDGLGGASGMKAGGQGQQPSVNSPRAKKRSRAALAPPSGDNFMPKVGSLMAASQESNVKKMVELVVPTLGVVQQSVQDVEIRLANMETLIKGFTSRVEAREHEGEMMDVEREVYEATLKQVEQAVMGQVVTLMTASQNRGMRSVAEFMPPLQSMQESIQGVGGKVQTFEGIVEDMVRNITVLEQSMALAQKGHEEMVSMRRHLVHFESKLETMKNLMEDAD